MAIYHVSEVGIVNVANHTNNCERSLKMLNKEAQEIQSAKLKFEVSNDFSKLQHAVQECAYFTSQYYINNTCLDLTVMDAIGIRQSLPRRKERKGNRVLTIIREYRFIKSLESHSRQFFEEITSSDGPILSELKSLVDSKGIFQMRGFTTEYDSGVRVGHLLLVTFEISEEQLMEYGTVDSAPLGITVSRLRREHMPANPIYSAINSNSYYNPFKHFVGPEYSMFRIFANYHHQIREKYWYNVGEIPIEVEYTRKPELEEGIHIQTYRKQEDSETATNNTIKIVKFEEATNKNGFFTSQRDAMLGSNTLRSDREKDLELKERAQLLAKEVAESEEKLTRSKQELTRLKQETEELNHRRTIQLQEIQHEQAIEAERQKRRTSDAEHRLVDGKLRLSAQQMQRDVVSFHQETEVSEQKRNLEMLKIQGGAIKHAQDLELATAKHRTTMSEMDRAETLGQAQHMAKLVLIEADLLSSASINKRRLVEENTKLVTSVAGGLTTIGKLLL